jgi:hypothetical protein
MLIKSGFSFEKYKEFITKSNEFPFAPTSKGVVVALDIN